MKRLAPVVGAIGLLSVSLAADGTQPFAQDLYRELGKSSKDVIYSPASIAQALEIARSGARGATKEEIEKVLHGVPANLVHEGVQSSNHIWAQKGMALKEGFVVDVVDFHDPKAARKTINDAIAKETKDRIRDLLPERAIDASVKLVLTNALHLDAKWQQPFEKSQTSDQAFHLADGSEVQVSTMHKTFGRGVKYGEKDGLQVLELPYDGTLVFDVILPKDMAKYELDLEGALALTKERAVFVALPRFELTSEIDLKDPLIAVGLKTAFGAGADFSGFTGSRDLYISDALTKTYVRVDEKGTEAAAATALVMKRGAMAPEEEFATMKVDRPFFFAIRETKTGSVAFFGRISKPAAPARAK